MASDSEHTTHVQQLFVQYGAEVKYFVLSLRPLPGEAEDMVKEPFLTVTAKAPDYEEGTNFEAWVFARLKVLEHLHPDKPVSDFYLDGIEVRLVDTYEPSTWFECLLSKSWNVKS